MIYLLAFLGGVILNLMPCTLPLVLVKLKNLDRYNARGHILGTLFVFACLGGLASTGARWGSLWDSDLATALLAVFTYACALAYGGVWQFPSFPVVDRIGSPFLRGVMCALFATPCSGPLLGPVFAWSMTQGPVQAFLIVFTVGLGMASPFLVCRFVDLSIRPGAWTVAVERLTSISLAMMAGWLASCVPLEYFPHPMGLIVGTGVFLFLCTCSLYGALEERRERLKVGVALSVLTVAFAIMLLTHNLRTQYDYDGTLPDKAIINFSTPTCLTCKANKLVLDSQQVLDACKRYGVSRIEVDVRTEAGEQLLRSYGLNSVPSLILRDHSDGQDREEGIVDLFSLNTFMAVFDRVFVRRPAEGISPTVTHGTNSTNHATGLSDGGNLEELDESDGRPDSGSYTFDGPPSHPAIDLADLADSQTGSPGVELQPEHDLPSGGGGGLGVDEVGTLDPSEALEVMPWKPTPPNETSLETSQPSSSSEYASDLAPNSSETSTTASSGHASPGKYENPGTPKPECRHSTACCLGRRQHRYKPNSAPVRSCLARSHCTARCLSTGILAARPARSLMGCWRRSRVRPNGSACRPLRHRS